MLKSNLAGHDSEATRRVRRIRERFLAGRDDGLDTLRSPVRESWLRSRSHAVDPSMRAAPLVVPPGLAHATPAADALKAAAAPVLAFLCDAIDRALVLLSDAQCRPIDIRGSRRTVDEAAQINVVLVGLPRCERRIGVAAVVGEVYRDGVEHVAVAR